MAIRFVIHKMISVKAGQTPWPEHTPPIMVGGVGGSGTRVVAEILLDLDIYLGSDFNGWPLDNLWFTFLLKRPSWYRKVCHDKAAPAQPLRILETVMRGDPIRSPNDLAFIFRAALEHSFALKNPPAANGVWPLIRAWKMLVTRPKPPERCRAWGWKEPNTHFYLEYLAEFFPQAKYVHTIRHGLDMAFSGNQQQLEHWGWLFGLGLPQSKEQLPAASLEFWVRANRRVREIGNALGPQRFLLLNFDQLCTDPETGVRQLLNFLGINVNPQKLDRLVRIPVIPKSAGRYRHHDLSGFRADMVDAVRGFGFEVASEAVKGGNLPVAVCKT